MVGKPEISDSCCEIVSVLFFIVSKKNENFIADNDRFLFLYNKKLKIFFGLQKLKKKYINAQKKMLKNFRRNKKKKK